MITSFDCKETKGIWNGLVSKKFPRDIQQVARRKLVHINSANLITDLRTPPGNRLEKLKGNYSKYHSIRINQKWRLIFIWQNGNAQQVKIVDYH